VCLKKHGYPFIVQLFRQYVEDLENNTGQQCLFKSPRISNRFQRYSLSFMLCLHFIFLVSGLFRDNIGAPVASRPRTGSLMPPTGRHRVEDPL
jgi:hypothetical protein